MKEKAAKNEALKSTMTSRARLKKASMWTMTVTSCQASTMQPPMKSSTTSMMATVSRATKRNPTTRAMRSLTYITSSMTRPTPKMKVPATEDQAFMNLNRLKTMMAKHLLHHSSNMNPTSTNLHYKKRGDNIQITTTTATTTMMITTPMTTTVTTETTTTTTRTMAMDTLGPTTPKGEGEEIPKIQKIRPVIITHFLR